MLNHVISQFYPLIYHSPPGFTHRPCIISQNLEYPRYNISDILVLYPSLKARDRASQESLVSLEYFGTVGLTYSSLQFLWYVVWFIIYGGMVKSKSLGIRNYVIARNMLGEIIFSRSTWDRKRK